jgi:hypothetical protein
MKEASTLFLRMPKDLKQRIEHHAKQQGVSLNQFAIYALTREIAQMEALDFFERRLSGKTPEQIREAFWRVIDRVSPNEVREWDTISENEYPTP